MIITAREIEDPLVQVGRMRIHMARVRALTVARASVTRQAALDEKDFSSVYQVCIGSIALVARTCVENNAAVWIPYRIL